MARPKHLNLSQKMLSSEGPGIENIRSRPSGLNISSDRSWSEIFRSLGTTPIPAGETLRSERAILGALGEFRGILGAALRIQKLILGMRNSVLGMASHDLSNTKTTILGATPRERFSFALAFSERFSRIGVVPALQKFAIEPFSVDKQGPRNRNSGIENFEPRLNMSSHEGLIFSIGICEAADLLEAPKRQKIKSSSKVTKK